MGESEKGGGDEAAAKGQCRQGKDDDAVQQEHLGLAFGSHHRICLKDEICQQVGEQASEGGGDGLFGHMGSGCWGWGSFEKLQRAMTRVFLSSKYSLIWL